MTAPLETTNATRIFPLGAESGLDAAGAGTALVSKATPDEFANRFSRVTSGTATTAATAADLPKNSLRFICISPHRSKFWRLRLRAQAASCPSNYYRKPRAIRDGSLHAAGDSLQRLSAGQLFGILCLQWRQNEFVRNRRGGFGTYQFGLALACSMLLRPSL